MSQDINERVARLEARQEIAEKIAATFAAESSEDRKALHKAIDNLASTMQEWRTSQRGYIAGVSSVIGVIVFLVTAGWEWIARHLK